MSSPNSRLPLDRSTNLPSIHTFGDLSNFLRQAVADEDSRQFSESMAELALHSEAAIAALRLDRGRTTAAPVLVDMMTVLRGHRTMVVGLGPSWRGLYEYAGYLHALNNFRVLIGQWLLQADPWDDRLPVTPEDFALVAWRTLGEGMLLVDMYEQWLRTEQSSPGTSLESLEALDAPRVERVLQWWQKLRR
jgi:hypothetical protein